MADSLEQICPLDTKVMEAFLEAFRLRILEPGDFLTRDGDLGDSVAFLVQGLLRSYYISAKGEERNKHFFLAGDFVAPLTSLVMGIPSPVNINALETTRLLVAPYSRVLQLYEEHPILNKLGRIIVEYAWIGKERRETQLIMFNATERYRAFREEFPGLESRIPQYQVASYLGITPVQLSRIRSSH